MFATKLIDLGREMECVGYYPDALMKKDNDRLGSSDDAYKRERSQEQKDKDNLERVVRRSKTKIRRLVKRYNMRYMWTLTISKQTTKLINPRTKKVTTYDCSTWEGAWKLFQLFIKRAQKAGLKFNYIATAEIQEERERKFGEKVFHFHMATDLYIPQNQMMLKKYNHSHKKQLEHSLNDFWSFGFTKVTQKKSNKFCSNYMVKYISKNFETLDLKAKQRYHVSQGMVIPIELMEFQSHKEFLQWCLLERIPKLDKQGNPVNKYFVLGDSLEIWWFLLEN
jgi:hypothetical protein